MEDRRKNCRASDGQQSSQKPVSPREALPEDDLVFRLLDLIRRLDLVTIHQLYARRCVASRPSTS